MATKQKLSYNDIGLILGRNGWIRNAEVEEELDFGYHFYDITLLSRDYYVTVRAWVGEHYEAIDLSGHYGVCTFEIVKYEYDPPFGETNLTDMLYAMEVAEDNLLFLGIPFCPNYRFHGSNVANKRRRNKALRKKFNLLSDEREAFRRKLAKYNYSEEELEASVLEQYPDPKD